MKVVIHELFHAFAHYLYLGSADLSVKQAEEIYAEYMEDALPIYAQLSTELHAALKKRYSL